MAKEKITEEGLVTRIRGEITDSLGYMGDTISTQREMAMKYYYGLPFGNEVDGRSQYVDSTVQDTIEWIKPSLMRVFASGDEMVKFTPHGPEDVKMAEQATDYVNYVFTKDNPGWEILYSWFTDALLSKNGIVKVWWDEYEEREREEYRRLTDIELTALVENPAVEVLEHTEYSEGEELEVTAIYHDVVITRNSYSGRVKIENIPPSEFLISREAKNIQDARFVCHRVLKTLSELKEMYPDEDLDPESLGGSDEDLMAFSAERLERYQFDKSAEYWEGWGNPVHNEDGLTTYWLHESYLKTDYDNDGITELRKVCTVGSTVLANEEIDSIPFVSKLINKHLNKKKKFRREIIINQIVRELINVMVVDVIDTTKRNLMSWGSFLFMGLIGIIIASLVNIFIGSSALQFAISVIGVLVFVGLTAYDTQTIKNMYYAGDSESVGGKKALMGALRLYLDFINLFIMLLRLFGQRR